METGTPVRLDKVRAVAFHSMMNLQPRRLLLVAEPYSYRIGAFVAAAGRMNMDVVIASRGEHSLVAEVHDGFHVDIANRDEAVRTILDHAAEVPFDGVLGIDDSTVELAATAAMKLGLPHNSPAAAIMARRKDLSRAHLAHAGCPVPPHWLISLNRPLPPQLAKIRFPCVVKPLALSASRGVIRANDRQELIAACRRIEPILAEQVDEFERRHLLVEGYINGVEVAYEGFLFDGELSTLVLFDKPDPLTGPYFEETIYVTPSRLSDEIQSVVKDRVAMACRAFGLTTGPVHAELRIDDGDAWILEVAARTIGGECARSLDDEAFNLEELAISLAVGEPGLMRPPENARGVMMMPVGKGGLLRRVEGVSAATAVEHVDAVDLMIRTGNELIPLPEGNRYPGYIFASAATPGEVVTALKEACSRIRFVTAPVFATTVTPPEPE